MRTKPLPRSTPTNYQNLIKSNYQQLIYSWRNLTDDQRKEWNEFPGTNLSGQALYFKYQSWRLAQGISLLTSISYEDMPTPPEIYQFTYYDADVFFLLDSTFDYSKLFFLCFASRIFPYNKPYRQSDTRLMIGSKSGTYVRVIKTSWQAHFGISLPRFNYVMIGLQWFSMTSPKWLPFKKFTFKGS